MYNTLFYLQEPIEIGGIESWFNYITEAYGDRDITICCRKCAPKQYQRLIRKVRVIFWNGVDTIECKRFFCCFNIEIMPYIKCEEKYICLHGNYYDMVQRGQLKRALLPLVDGVKYLATSKSVADGWEKLTGKKAKVVYNPIVLKEPRKKIIRFCAAQRMSAEKGGERIKEFVKCCDEYVKQNDEYDYTLDIYTNDYGLDVMKDINSSHVGLHKPRLDINRSFGFYDWFLCLSDDEGYGYSPAEALIRGTPCIITDLKVFTELGYSKHNSIRLKLDCSNMDDVVKQAFTKKLTFEYKPVKDLWGELIINEPKTYKFKEEKMARIKANFTFDDTYEHVRINKGDVYETTEERANYLTNYVIQVSGEYIYACEKTKEKVNVSWQEPQKAKRKK